MDSLRAEPLRAFTTGVPLAARTTMAQHRAVRRRLASMSPLLATLLLTGAAFLLPATSDRRQAHAADGDIQLSATHIDLSGVKASRY